MGLNDVCVFFPAWFGAVATLLVAFLTAECSGSGTSAVVAALVMSIIPAHTMRSVGGGYDNESLAVTAMCLTFFAWVRALRTRRSWPVGALAGLCYVYMVAAWGGYVFVLNMIGLHAAVIVLVGKFDSSAHKAYSLFWIVGTLGAIQFPVVGLAPIKSAEQLGPMCVFLGYQALALAEFLVKRAQKTGPEAWRIRLRVYTTCAGCVFALALCLAPTGWFGPLSVRVRGLFIKHTKTGNPLVDSVAEHQPGSADAYFRYLHYPFYVAPVGFCVAVAHFFSDERSAAALFLPLYAAVAYYFANRMVRLIIFLGPIASSLTGIAVGYALDDIFATAHWQLAGAQRLEDGEEEDERDEQRDDARGWTFERPIATERAEEVRRSGEIGNRAPRICRSNAIGAEICKPRHGISPAASPPPRARERHRRNRRSNRRCPRRFRNAATLPFSRLKTRAKLSRVLIAD